MTFEEFLEKCREVDGWKLIEPSFTRDWGGLIRNRRNECPLAAVFGTFYATEAKKQGLPAEAIMNAADGKPRARYRKALLTLVQS